jgi:hypothetical protein
MKSNKAVKGRHKNTWAGLPKPTAFPALYRGVDMTPSVKFTYTNICFFFKDFFSK